MILSEAEYHHHSNENDGYCTKCDDITNFGGVEPDARKYPCETCDGKTVYGIEEAFMMGLILIGDEDGHA